MEKLCLCIPTEIPLFHVLNAKVTFGNINAGHSAVSGVQRVNGFQSKEGSGDDDTAGCDQESYNDQTVRCAIDTSCFDAPAGYRLVRTDEPARKYLYNISTKYNHYSCLKGNDS